MGVAATLSELSEWTLPLTEFAPVLGQWKVKSNERPECARTGNEKQQTATMCNKKRKRASRLKKPKQAIKAKTSNK